MFRVLEGDFFLFFLRKKEKEEEECKFFSRVSKLRCRERGERREREEILFRFFLDIFTHIHNFLLLTG